jgi:hypothetical protein
MCPPIDSTGSSLGLPPACTELVEGEKAIRTPIFQVMS